MSKIIYVTAEWLKKLQDELTHLKDVARVEVADKLKEAISFWDLSENAEYEEARNLQSQVEVRITELEGQLKNIELIDEETKDTSKVNMWDTVTIVCTTDNEELVYKIVWTTESDVLAVPQRISNECVIGKALMWKKKGTTIKAKSNAGTKEYKIIKIS